MNDDDDNNADDGFIAVGDALGHRQWTVNTRATDKATSDGARTPAISIKPRAFNYEEFLSLVVPPRELLLPPWLPAKGLAMVYGPRGVGKTLFAMGSACAVATGAPFLRWLAEDPRKVIMIDGEMPVASLQERLAQAMAHSGMKPPAPEYLRILASDASTEGLPDLSDPRSHAFYSDHIGDCDLVIVDNISTLCPGVKENDADSWAVMQAWALAQRRLGRSVLFVHHGGKSGRQRGTSRKEDVLDTVIALRRPPGYRADQGARFEVHFEKARGFRGQDAEPFEASLATDEWTIRSVMAEDNVETMSGMHQDGLPLREIAKRIGLSKSTVHRRLVGTEGKAVSRGTPPISVPRDTAADTGESSE